MVYFLFRKQAALRTEHAAVVRSVEGADPGGAALLVDRLARRREGRRLADDSADGRSLQAGLFTVLAPRLRLGRTGLSGPLQTGARAAQRVTYGSYFFVTTTNEFISPLAGHIQITCKQHASTYFRIM